MIAPTTSTKFMAVCQQRVVVEDLRLAVHFWSRLVGLQFQPPLPPTAGLLIAPCASVHTMCMRFSIDVAFIGQDGVVVDVRRDLKPWRVYASKIPARYALEVLAGSLKLTAGNQVSIVSNQVVPSVLLPLCKHTPPPS